LACFAPERWRSRPWGAAALADTHRFDATRGLDDAVRRLRSIRRVGEWTAQCIALHQLREPDAFPALMRVIASLERRKYSLSELLDRADSWRPWRAYAAQLRNDVSRRRMGSVELQKWLET
jgi:AraC family transcriptional regulator of adaptative response / DNA-3-methyladenine glycosylase II